MDKRLLVFFTVFLILSTTYHVYGESIPPNIWEFTEDYYNVIGEPQLSASIVGNPEYESGETSTIFIQLINDGLVYGFETDKKPSDLNTDESIDARTEFDLEYDVTTAINIRGVLENEQAAPIRIISGLQQGGSLRSGEISQPLEFDIEVYNNAPSRIYNLTVNLTYQYQYEAKVEGYPNQEFDFLYVTKNQTLPVQIKVKPKAYFEIENVRSDLRAGDQNILYITYKNIGNEVADDAVARISVVDPFSTADDQAFLGTLHPGDSYQTQYKMKIDTDALPKTYGINTEVKYRDEHGDIQISNVMKAEVTVNEFIPFTERIGLAGYIIIITVLLGVIGLYIYMKQNKK
jgi:hypothetical protein